MENSVREKTKQEKREAASDHNTGNKKETSNQKSTPASDNIPAEYETASSNKGQGPSGENL